MTKDVNKTKDRDKYLSRFGVYNEKEQGPYEDLDSVNIELSDGRTAVQEPGGKTYIRD